MRAESLGVTSAVVGVSARERLSNAFGQHEPCCDGCASDINMNDGLLVSPRSLALDTVASGIIV